MSSGRLLIGAFTDVFLWGYMPPCGKGLAVPYILSALTESLVVSGKLRIIPYRMYSL